MLRARNRFARNPYFHPHPMHSAFSLVAALILVALILGFVMWMPR